MSDNWIIILLMMFLSILIFFSIKNPKYEIIEGVEVLKVRQSFCLDDIQSDFFKKENIYKDVTYQLYEVKRNTKTNEYKIKIDRKWILLNDWEISTLNDQLKNGIEHPVLILKD